MAETYRIDAAGIPVKYQPKCPLCIRFLDSVADTPRPRGDGPKGKVDQSLWPVVGDAIFDDLMRWVSIGRPIHDCQECHAIYGLGPLMEKIPPKSVPLTRIMALQAEHKRKHPVRVLERTPQEENEDDPE